MIPIIVLVKLIAAHLIGDFVLQSDKLCNNKFSISPCLRYSSLLLHSGIVAALSYLFLAQWSNWIIPAIIGIMHFLIDWTKVSFNKNGILSFLIDQLAHFCVILIIWWTYYILYPHTLLTSHYSLKLWIIITTYIAVMKPSSIFIKLFLEHEKWTPDRSVLNGLPNAGKWIGYLERILILTFIYSSNFEAIGFLLAAKSVFRFGELNKARDIKVTEYVLIGTFLSFTIAIILGLATSHILDL